MKTSMRNWLLITIGLFGIQLSTALAKEDFSPKILEKAKKSIVTIHGQASLKAYDPLPNSWTGTGFIINKAKGHILTNAHVVGGAVVGNYYLFLHNGSRVDAKLLYYDPWLDYAFLQIDPKMIPQDATEVKFSAKNPSIDQPIFVIGNNEGKSFSIHTGSITGLYEISGAMPQHAIRLSLNTTGGSSGSPIMNQQGEAIALNYGGSDTYALGLHAGYIRYALGFVEKGHIPVRKHIGVVSEIYSLNEATKYRGFPLALVQAYAKKFPLAMGNAIQVNRILAGSPADGKLLAGDIIWAVDDKEIGPSLVDLDLAFNQAKDNQVKLTIYRYGQKQDILVPLYHLEDHKIKQMVSWGGTLFFEADDFFSDKVGIPAKSLAFAIVQGSTTFDQVRPAIPTEQGRILALQVLRIDQQPVVDLNQLISLVPSYIKQKYFTINYINYIPRMSFGSWYIFGPRYYTADINYDENTPEPKIFIFNQEKSEWESKLIPVN